MAVREITMPMPTYDEYYGAGAPTNDSTFLGVAKVGATYSDTTNGKLYICTVSTASNITWVVVGSQS